MMQIDKITPLSMDNSKVIHSKDVHNKAIYNKNINDGNSSHQHFEKTTPNQKTGLIKSALIITGFLFLTIFAIWHFWPIILINSIHWQKESLDYLTDQFYSDSAYAHLIILGVCFLYGALHALGPGHGKVVVNTYLATNDTKLKTGIYITLGAALVQALVAVSLVSVFLFVFHQTMHKLNATVNDLTTYSGVLVAILGGLLIYKAIHKFYITSKTTNHHHHHGEQCGCGHIHGADAEQLNKISKPKEYLMIILSIGLRPCSGAILILFFSSLTNLYWVGIIGTFLMSLGTALTTSTIAFLTVSGRKIIQYYSNASFNIHYVVPILIKILMGLFLITIGILLIEIPSYGLSPILS